MAGPVDAAGGASPAAAPPLLTALSELLAGAEEGLLIVDGAGSLRFASPTALAQLGLDPSRVGDRLVDIGADYRLVRLVQVAAGVGAQVVERCWEVEERTLALRATTLAVPDHAVLVWVRDETPRRQLEKMRRDFVSNVSHELRTPLAAMRVMVETLQGGALADPPAAREFVARIALEVEHMGHMVEELLELSAIEARQRAFEQAQVPVATLFQAIERLRPLIDDKAIHLEVDTAADVPDIRGDREHLQQVLRNLVHNAVKFTPPQGRIEVSARGVDGAVVLRVTDTGVGIRAGDLPRIFERFWKADASRQRDGEGTGLGLAIARHVVAAHGGSITAHSEPGAGATFVVTLPAWPGPP